MVNDIEKSVLRGEYALGVFLDIAGAFDNLSLSSAVQGMRNKGIPETITSWYSHYLHNRTAHATLRGCYSTHILTKGTPQGGVLSPLIWNLGFDGLLDLFDKGPVRIKGFADDAALLVSGRDPYTLVQIMQTALIKAKTWGDQHGLCLLYTSPSPRDRG